MGHFWTSEPNCESEPTEFKLGPAFVAPKLRVFVLYDITVLESGQNLHRRFPLLDELSLVSSMFKEAPFVTGPF